MSEWTDATLRDVREYMASGKLLALSSTDGVSLHMCSVWYAMAEDYSALYFTSRDTRVHSNDIRKNGKVGGAIVSLELTGLGQKTQGVFFSGTSRECATDASDEPYAQYRRRWPQVGDMFTLQDIRSGATPMRMFVIEPTEYVWIDEVRMPTDPRYVIAANEVRLRSGSAPTHAP